MKMSAELANQVFDIIANEGNHAKSYIDYRRAEFVDNMVREGAWELWYPTECGSSIKVYFRTNMTRKAVFTVYAQTINDIKEPTLVEDVTKAFNELTMTLAPLPIDEY